MDESNIDVKFSDGTLTIKGEKRDEKEEKKKGYYLSERRYGSFHRSFGVPDGNDAEKIEANFKNGVLTVTLPKTRLKHRALASLAAFRRFGHWGALAAPAGPLGGCQPVLRACIEDERVNEGDYALIIATSG
jgi:hypothetical protein